MKMKTVRQMTAALTAGILAAACLMGCGGSGSAASGTSSAAQSTAQSTAAESAAQSTAQESTAAESTGTASNRLEKIKQAGVLTVATEPYFAPQEFIDPSKTGQDQYVGADMELAKKIAEKIGVELEIVPLEFTAVLSSVAEGKYDLAISALAYTPARAEAMTLSKGYHFSDNEYGYGLLIREEMKDQITGPDDLKDYVVITQSGSLQEAMVNSQVKEYKEFKRVSSMDDAFLAVKEGKADAAAVAVENANLFIANNPDAHMMVPDFRFTLEKELDGTRIGIPLGETELEAVVNEVIDEVLAENLYEQWFEEASAYAKSLGIE